MSEVKITYNGGPAFPSVSGPHKDKNGNITYPIQYGMSLRDWFAGTLSLENGEPSPTQAAAVMGENPPDWLTDNALECVMWWLNAEAKLRYMRADAMLKARETK